MARAIERLSTGRYKVRFRYGVSEKTGRPKQTSETFATRKQAEEFAGWYDALGAQGALDRLYAGEQEAEAPTLDQLAAEHIEHLTGIEHGTRVKYARLWARTWGPLIGSVPANVITADHVRRAVNALGDRYARKSLENQRGLLSGVLDRAIEQGHLARNPAKGVRLPAGRHVVVGEDDEDDDAEMVFLAPDEYRLLEDAVAPHYRPLVKFLAGTGCRWGEAVALRKRDVDLATSTIKVRRALKWSPDGRQVIGPPKTKKSRRTVALPPEIIDDLRELTKGKATGDFVFTAPAGGMVQHRTFWSDHWRPAIFRAQHCPEHADPACRCGTAHPKRCKVHDKPPPPCGCPGTLGQAPRIHDLRHSHASWLLAHGVPIHVVQIRLGHESIQTTVDTYGHLLPDAQVLAAQAASLVFTPPPTSGQIQARVVAGELA